MRCLHEYTIKSPNKTFYRDEVAIMLNWQNWYQFSLSATLLKLFSYSQIINFWSGTLSTIHSYNIYTVNNEKFSARKQVKYKLQTDF